MKIELDKVYTYEDCSEIMPNKTPYYFKTKVREKKLKADATNPKYSWEKAVYGRDLIRFLQTLQWGRRLLKEWSIDQIHEDLFVDRDRKELEDKLKHLLLVKDQRERSLQITINKIKDVERQLKEIKERGK